MGKYDVIIAGKPPQEQLAILEEIKSETKKLCDIVEIGRKINELKHHIAKFTDNQNSVQGIINSIELLTAQNRLDEAKTAFERVYNVTYKISPEESRYLQFLWKHIEKKEINNNSLVKFNSSSQGEAYARLNQLRMYFHAGKVTKAKKVANDIIEQYSSYLEGDDLTEFLQMVSEMRSIPQTPSNRATPHPSGQHDNDAYTDDHYEETEDTQLFPSRNDLDDRKLAAYILAQFFLENEAYMLPEARENIDHFVRQVRKKARFNDSLISEIANIILQNVEACFAPYRQLMEEQENE